MAKKKKRKTKKTRNYVVIKMIERNQKAGYHINKKKQKNKMKCRKKIDKNHGD